MLNEKMSDLRFKLSEKSLQLLPEYHQKLDVRRERERQRDRDRDKERETERGEGERKERVHIYSPFLSSGPQTFWFH